ncbi:MAG: hypothetical protein WDM78_23440 [Puia sp.]
MILGLGYDAALGDKIGITIIATGFEYKDPFKRAEKPAAPKKEEKIVNAPADACDGNDKKGKPCR